MSINNSNIVVQACNFSGSFSSQVKLNFLLSNYSYHLKKTSLNKWKFKFKEGYVSEIRNFKFKQIYIFSC